MTRLALIGGDDGLRDELVGVLRSLPALELLPGRGGEGAELLLVAGDDTLSAHDRCRTHAGVVPCVLVVDDAGDGEAARAAMAAGARAIVGRPLQAFELSRAADAARSFMTAAATGAPRGRVVVVTAGAGGVGVSTLTAALVGILPGPVAVLDLDPAGGVLAERLGVPVRTDGAGLAGEDSGRRAFERLAEHLPDGFLISSPPWPELAWTVREGVARELVEAAAAVCASVLVDAGRGVGPALEALQVADLVLLVGRAGAAGTAAAVRHRTYLGRIGVGDDRLRVCRNVCSRRDVVAARVGTAGPLGRVPTVPFDEDLAEGHVGAGLRKRLAALVAGSEERVA